LRALAVVVPLRALVGLILGVLVGLREGRRRERQDGGRRGDARKMMKIHESKSFGWVLETCPEESKCCDEAGILSRRRGSIEVTRQGFLTDDTYPRTMKSFAWTALAAVTLFSAAVTFAQAEPLNKPGPWHSRSCVDTTVAAVTPRLGNAGQTTFSAQDFEQSGVSVAFNTRLGALPGSGARAAVTHYQGEPGNDVMARERAGDRVQVCFLGGPKPSKFCDPKKDPRGRSYRVYDYRQRAAYSGMNSEHDCGGA
jgi:hypothetical protein